MAKRGKKGSKRDRVAERLARLPAEAARELPSMPIAVAVRELGELARAADKARSELAKLPGFDQSDVDDLPVLVSALDEAEDAWQAARAAAAAGKDARAARRDAEKLRSRLFAAGRYLLRKDAVAQARLDEIAEGSGLDDLIADLKALAALADANAAAFAADKRLDGAAASARKAAEALSGQTDDEPALQALEQRNRIYAVAREVAQEVRAAARYLYRDDPKRLKRFVSAYESERGRRHRARTPPAAPGPMPAA